MTLDELERCLSLGLDHACVVDVQLVPEAPGYVRTVSVHAGRRVNIEFDVWGMDEGGLYYWASFESLGAVVACLEPYLGRPLAKWRCLGPETYPERRPETGTEQGHRRFEELLGRGGPPLPAHGEFRTQSTYWLQFLSEKPGSGGE